MELKIFLKVIFAQVEQSLKIYSRDRLAKPGELCISYLRFEILHRTIWTCLGHRFYTGHSIDLAVKMKQERLSW